MLIGFNHETPNIIMWIIGGLWLLKKVADMERFHDFRLMALTLILSFVVIFLFLRYGFTFGTPYNDCVIEVGNHIDQQYPCVED